MESACAIFPSVACPALLYSSTLSPERHVFRKKKVTEPKMCVVISLQILFEIFPILGRIQRDIVKM